MDQRDGFQTPSLPRSVPSEAYVTHSRCQSAIARLSTELVSTCDWAVKHPPLGTRAMLAPSDWQPWCARCDGEPRSFTRALANPSRTWRERLQFTAYKSSRSACRHETAASGESVCCADRQLTPAKLRARVCVCVCTKLDEVCQAKSNQFFLMSSIPFL